MDEIQATEINENRVSFSLQQCQAKARAEPKGCLSIAERRRKITESKFISKILWSLKIKC